MSKPDLFGDRAEEYARHRPSYPEELFDRLGALVVRRELAWDCGAGSGQASRSLALRFERVVATDSSLRQLASGVAAERVGRVAATAERTPLRDRCADLITVSAALHWFDRRKFWEEVQRVARPGAVVAAWSYYRSRTDRAIDAIEIRYANDVVGSAWPAGFALNRANYGDLDFPFERLPWPELYAEARMRLSDYLAYMRTWSASQAWAREHGSDPVEQVRDNLERAWGDPELERSVRWPLHGVIGRVN